MLLEQNLQPNFFPCRQKVFVSFLSFFLYSSFCWYGKEAAEIQFLSPRIYVKWKTKEFSSFFFSYLGKVEPFLLLFCVCVRRGYLEPGYIRANQHRIGGVNRGRKENRPSGIVLGFYTNDVVDDKLRIWVLVCWTKNWTFIIIRNRFCFAYQNGFFFLIKTNSLESYCVEWILKWLYPFFGSFFSSSSSQFTLKFLTILKLYFELKDKLSHMKTIINEIETEIDIKLQCHDISSLKQFISTVQWNGWIDHFGLFNGFRLAVSFDVSFEPCLSA